MFGVGVEVRGHPQLHAKLPRLFATVVATILSVPIQFESEYNTPATAAALVWSIAITVAPPCRGVDESHAGGAHNQQQGTAASQHGAGPVGAAAVHTGSLHGPGGLAVGSPQSIPINHTSTAAAAGGSARISAVYLRRGMAAAVSGEAAKQLHARPRT